MSSDLPQITEKMFIDKWIYENTTGSGPMSFWPRTKEEWEVKASRFISESKTFLRIMGIDRPEYLTSDNIEKMAEEAIKHIEDMINYPGDRG